MTKKHKTKQSKRKQPSTALVTRTYGRPSRSQRTGAVPRALKQAVCSQVDPFCPHAQGAKRYGSDASYTIPMAIRKFVSIGTNASGDACLHFSTKLDNMYATAGTVVSGVPGTWYYNDAPDYANFSSYFSAFRVVNSGIRVFSQVSATASQGVVHAIVQKTDLTLAQGVDLTSSFHEEVERYPLAGVDLHIIAKPDGEAANTWHPINELTTAYNDIYIGFTGCAASTTVAAAEIVMHVEFQPITNSTWGQLSSPPAPAHPLIQAAASNVQRGMKSISNGATAAFGRTIESMAERALRSLAPAAAGFMFGPAAGAGVGLLTNGLAPIDVD